MAQRLSDSDFFDYSVTIGAADNLSVVMGVNSSDGKGNITIFGSYEDMEEMLGDDGDTGACPYLGTLNPFCGGSSNFRRSTAQLVTVWLASSSKARWDVDSICWYSDQYYNYGEIAITSAPLNWNLGANGHYNLTENVEAYFDSNYMNMKTVAQIAESASFNRAFETNCDNPLLQAVT